MYDLIARRAVPCNKWPCGAEPRCDPGENHMVQEDIAS